MHGGRVPHHVGAFAHVELQLLRQAEREGVAPGLGDQLLRQSDPHRLRDLQPGQLLAQHFALGKPGGGSRSLTPCRPASWRWLERGQRCRAARRLRHANFVPAARWNPWLQRNWLAQARAQLERGCHCAWD